MINSREVTDDEMRQMRERLYAYEQQYGRPSSRMLDAPDFRDENGDLVETADLLAWSSLWDKYSLLTALPHVEADLVWEADDGLNQARLPGGLDLNPGDRITTGQSGFNVLAVVQRVEDGDCGTRWVLFRQVDLLEPGDVGYEAAPRRGKALRSSHGKLRHLANTPVTRDVTAVRPDLTEQADRAWLTPDDTSPIDRVEAAVVDGLMAEVRALTAQLAVARQPGISDYRVLHHGEQQGVRTYLIVVVEGRASVVRLTIVLDRGQTSAEMDSLLDGVAEGWKAKLRALTPEQQTQFAAAVDETVDPYVLLEDVRRPAFLASIAPPVGYQDSGF